MKFNAIIEQLIQETQTNTEQGKKFEILIKKILQVDCFLQKEFDIKEVYLWNEFSDKFHINRHDFGIDIILITMQDEIIAVQCKAFKPMHTLVIGDLKGFLGINTIIDNAGKEYAKISQSLLFHTCKKISTEVEMALEQNANEGKLKAIAFGYNELKNLEIDYQSLDLNAIATTTKSKDKKSLRPHQNEAFKAIKKHFVEQNNERGKVIMACGTGKSLLAIRTIDSMVENGEIAVFLTPSLALTNQMIKEFFAQSVSKDYKVFAVCSDSKVGSSIAPKDKNKDDVSDITSNELCIPATTSPIILAKSINALLHTPLDSAFKAMGGGHKQTTSLSSQDVNTPKLPKIIIFSTYQSIDVVIEAQKLFKSQIKLIINDEAHRTAGVQKLDSEGEKRDISVWQRTHDNALLNARFRLYLTATPRIYSPKAKEGLSKKAQGKDLMLFSMDDESLFGKEIYSLNFGKAISENLLSDFRVIISYCREEVVAEYLGKLTKAQENSKLSIESAGKMISFANALRKINMSFVDESGIHEAFKEDKEPMKRAVCFHSSIRNSKFATEQFSKISATILLDHIDGTHNAYQKAEKLSWLSEEEEGKCRVLSNAKCLTEGIDVPNLDAVCFFDKRDSIVDIVQAVGRTIRKSEGKKYGYIILPLVLTDEEIKDYNKTLKSDKFKIVWETLKALRSHDERLIDEARIAEVVSFLTDSSEIKELPEATLFTLDELFNEIKNAVPKNLGDLQYWEHYASKVGSIMHNLMLRIQTLNAQNAKIKSLFEGFCKALRGNLNVSFDTDDAIALIAQHIITKPIFECIFSNLNFATFDKVSAELEKLYKKLLNYGLGTETKELEKFYISVRSNAEYAKSDKSKQNLIKNLYDTLFKEAFKKTQEKLGIVYTPIQGVDFVIHSVAYALKKHFNKNLSDDNIHICDPFTGTGTFITRLLQSGYLDSNLESKYKNELWANEITLLGYYIAQINITTTYHDRLLKLKYLDSLSNRESSSRDIFSTAITSNSSAIAHTPEALSGRGIDKGEGATSPNSSPSPLSEKHNNNAFTLFDNLLFTDTFNTYTPDSKGFKVPFTKRQSMQLESEYFAKNLAKIQEFKNTDFKIFIANPPYSTGQKNANDNNKNTSYPFLESRIAETYVAKTKATNKGSNYDSYKMAIRYCSDRIGDNGGIIGFITNGSFIDGNSDSGLRACLEQEFDYIYIFNLRGNARTQGEFRQKEGAGFFDSGSRTPVAITLLIKCTDSAKSPDKKAQILYYDIGDYLSREQKLNIISNFKSIEGIEKQGLWQKIESNKDYDWINQRDYGFMQYLDINEIFECKSKGIQVISYDWQYNFSKTSLKETMNQTIDIYNNEANRLHCKNQEEFEIQAIKDTKQIRWNSSLYSKCFRKIKAQKSSEIIEIQIRPFSKINFFNNPIFIHRKGNEKFMPQNQKNIFIFTTNQAKNFSSLISNYIVDIEFLTKVQAFPLYYYEKIESQDTQGEQSVMDTDNNTLSEAHTIDFDDNVAYYKRKDAIRDEALAKFQEVYSTFWEQNPQFANKSSCEVYPHCDKIKSHDSATLKALSGWGIDKGEGATSPNSSPSPLSENTIISKVIKKAHCV